MTIHVHQDRSRSCATWLNHDQSSDLTLCFSLSLSLSHSSELIYTRDSHRCHKWTLYRPAGWYGSAPCLCSAPFPLLPPFWEGCRPPRDETASDYPSAWIVPWRHWHIQPLKIKTDARVAKFYFPTIVRVPTNQLTHGRKSMNQELLSLHPGS